MDKEAINAIIKGIKEGAQAMTPLAKDYVHQIQMRGAIDFLFGLLIVMIIAFSSLLIFKSYKKYQESEKSHSYSTDENVMALLFMFGIVSIVGAGFSAYLIGTGLETIVAPLPTILGK